MTFKSIPSEIEIARVSGFGSAVMRTSVAVRVITAEEFLGVRYAHLEGRCANQRNQPTRSHVGLDPHPCLPSMVRWNSTTAGREKTKASTQV